MPFRLFQTAPIPAPLSARFLELTAATEAKLPKLADKPLRTLLLARCGAVRNFTGDRAGAAARVSEATSLLATLTDDEATSLDRGKLGMALLRAGDSEAAKAQFDRVRQKADEETDASLRLAALRNLAESLHNAGDDKAARAILREIVPEVKKVDGADSSAFALVLYALADYGDPDLAEQHAPQYTDTTSRAVVLRKVAIARRKSDPARAKATMLRAIQVASADKNRSPMVFNGHLGAMALNLGMKVEAQALVTKLPALFPKKAEKEALKKALPSYLAMLGQFPKALALADALPAKDRRAKLFELVDIAISLKNAAAVEQLLQKLMGIVEKDPALKKDPDAIASIPFTFNLFRLALAINLGDTARQLSLLSTIQAQALKIPKKPEEEAEMELSIAEIAIGILREKE